MGLIEINLVWSLPGWPCYIIVHVCFSTAIDHLLLSIVQKWQEHLVVRCFQWGKYVQFACSMVVILYTLWLSMMTVIFCWNLGCHLNDFNFYVMGKKYMLSLLCAFLVWAIVLKVVKLQVILSCSEQNIFILVDKMFWHISVGLSRLIDRLL